MSTTFRTEISETPTWIRLIGELDLASAHQATDDIVASRCHIVDCTDLTFLDSSGVDALTTAHQKTEANGTHLTFTGITGTPHRVLTITGHDKILHVA